MTELYDTIEQSRKMKRKRRTNHYYGTSPLETAHKHVEAYRSKRLRGATDVWSYVSEPESYDNPWDAPIWRKWQGRAEEFWDARLQPSIRWEYEKNHEARR